MDLDHPPTGADDRTGTVAFMATAMLGPEPCTHRPIHDCESIFWLCALSLLDRIGVGGTREDLGIIAIPSNDAISICINRSI